jgi:hypothetical protein
VLHHGVEIPLLSLLFRVSKTLYIFAPSMNRRTHLIGTDIRQRIYEKRVGGMTFAQIGRELVICRQKASSIYKEIMTSGSFARQKRFRLARRDCVLTADDLPSLLDVLYSDRAANPFDIAQHLSLVLRKRVTWNAVRAAMHVCLIFLPPFFADFYLIESSYHIQKGVAPVQTTRS